MMERKLSYALVISVAAAITLSACSSSGGSGVTNSTSGLTFPIGVSTSLTGADGELGLQARAAIEKFVSWNNAAHTGVTFKIVGVQDDQGSPATGRQNATQLVSDGAKAIVGDMSSAVAEAVEPVVLANKAIYTVSGSWADDLTGPSKPLAFRVGAWNSGLAQFGIEPYLKHLAQTSHLTRVGLLTEDSPYGTGAAQQMIKLSAAQTPGIKMYNVQYPANATDVTGQLLRLKADNPQLIIISATEAGRNTSIKQAKQVGITAPILAQWNWPTYSDFWQVVGKAGVGIKYVDFDAPTRTPTPMANTMKQQLGTTPSIWAEWAWDAMLALRAGVLAAKSTDTQKVASAMAHVSFGGATGQISFDTSKTNYHNRKSLPAFILQLNKVNGGASNAKVLFTSNS